MTDDAGLTPISENCLAAIKENREEIISRTVADIKAVMEKNERLTEQTARKLSEGIKMTMDMLLPIMEFGAEQLLDEQLSWAENRLPEEGFSVDAVSNNFRCLQNSFREILPKEPFDELTPYFDAVFRHLPG